MPADLPTGGSPMASVTIDGIGKRFGRHQAVQPTSFSIPAGTFATLVGPSGSGKTTILKMIAGFEEPTSGRVIVAGADVTRVPPHKRNIGFVFQQYALFPHLTVFDNIAYPLRIRRLPAQETKARVGEALQLVQLSGFGDRFPAQLSGGQQQRVALARAIVFRPPVLLMDEPMSALDKRLRDEMQYELRDLQRKLGITTIAVTHDQTEALVMSDVVVVLNRGAIEQIGPPAEIYRKPQSEFVATFVGESNILRGKAVAHECGLWLEVDGKPRLPLPGMAHGAPGGSVAYVLRPEAVSVGDGGADAVNVEGEVLETSFVGESRRLRIGLGWGAPLIVKVPNRVDLRTPQVGERAGVTWHPGDASVIPS